MQWAEGARRWWRPALATFGLVLAAFFFLVYRQVLTIVEKPSWPPGAGAITAAGRGSRRRESFAARSDVKPSDVGMPYAWSTAATIEPWPEGKNFFPRIFDDIEQAHSSVHILMFGWREGEVGHELTDAPEQKRRRASRCGSSSTPPGASRSAPAEAMFTRLAAAGAQIVVNDTLPVDEDGLYADQRAFDWRQDEVGQADHRKLYVIDGTVAWTGGAGIEDHFDDGSFHDVMARVTGNVVRQAQARLPDELPRLRRPPPGRPLEVLPGAAATRARPRRASPDRARRVRVRDPGDPRADRPREDAARRDEPVPHGRRHDPADHRRREAWRRRSDLRLRDVEQHAGDGGLEHHYRGLLDAGVTIYEYPGAVVHAKVIVADDTVVFGTVNLDAWALYRNYEIAMMARSAPAAALFEERVFGPDVAQSRPGEPPTGLGARARGLGLGQARLLHLSGRSVEQASHSDGDRCPGEKERSRDREPHPPAGAAAHGSVVVDEILDRREGHHGPASQYVDNAEPRAARQRPDAGERDQAEEHDQPAVVRSFEPVERDRPGAAPGAEHAEDREDDRDPAPPGDAAVADRASERRRGNLHA